ncbi:MAG: sugar transferase [Synechococcales bacterium]|nr:sugar transferase [Synechococcales bacterium]
MNYHLQIWIKSLIDRTVAAIALLLLSPVMLLTALLIHWQMGQPVIFAQPRPGHHGRIFQFYKFRSMTNVRDAEGNLLPDTQRLTPLGQLLRTTSLDELPQLWNVLKGDMSIVGPRPLLVEFLNYYSPQQARRHEAKPGITGWAQVNGRHTVSWADKCTLDVWYVDHWSLGLDLKILWMTVGKVLSRRDIGTPGCHQESAQQLAAVRETKQVS